MTEKKLIIFTDSGDTIIDESTEVRDDKGIVVHAELMKGAREVLCHLYEEGYTIALVADGEDASFQNVYRENGLAYCFKTQTISEIVGIQKPAAEMFEDAMRKNNLTDADKYRIVMIGNNIRKDIKGARAFGIKSIWIHWNERYNTVPRDASEIADYVIEKPEELPALIEKLNKEISD